MATWEVTWHNPLELRESRDTRYIYECDLEALNVWPGLYIFARTHGESIEPIYIGETENLRRRIEQHLASVPLMNGLKYARTGRRVLMVGELETRRGPSRQTDTSEDRASSYQGSSQPRPRTSERSRNPLRDGRHRVAWQSSRT